MEWVCTGRLYTCLLAPDSHVTACLCVCLSSICLSVCVCVPACLSVCLWVCLPVCVFVFLCLCVSTCLSVCLPVCVSTCLSVCMCQGNDIHLHHNAGVLVRHQTLVADQLHSACYLCTSHSLPRCLTNILLVVILYKTTHTDTVVSLVLSERR